MNYSRVYGVLTLVLALGSLGGCENVDDLKDVDMLGDDFQINARAGDMAAPGFPPWVRADLVPGAVPPILKLAPLHGLGDQQTVDGLVNPTIEYANGAQAALSDWYSGMAPGDMHLQLAGQKLLIGIRIAPGDCDPYGCSVFVAIDENRAATLTNHDTPFGPEDRGVVVQWARPSDVTIGQWSGTHALGNLPQSQQWPVVARVGSEPSNGRKSIELEITLGTAAATAQTISNPRAMPFGLAVAVVGNKAPKLSLVSKSPTNSYYVWPNEPHPAGGQWIALPNFPFTYKTIQPDFPTGKTTGILTYNVGMLPFLSNGGDGSPHDFAAYAADPDVQVACLQEVWDHAQRREIAAIANELAKMHAVGLPQTCGGGDESGCDAADLAADLVTSSGITIPDTGLLLLSKSPIADSDIMFYKNSESGCRGADCLEEKGALWARIGTANAKREPKCNSSSSQVTGSITHVPDRYCSPPVYAGEQFIDVFCTHLQASCDEVSTIAKYVDALEAVLTTGGSEILEAVGIDPINMEKFECHGDDDYKNVQKKQLTKLGGWIQQKRASAPSMTDRPAIVLGDFNINGRSAEDLKLGPSNGSLYAYAASSLGAYNRTIFEEQMEIYSDRHDIGLGFHNPVAVVPPVRGSDPVLVEETADLARKYPSMPISTFGESTMTKELTLMHDYASSRYDYVWVLPAEPSSELPFYAIASSPEEPYVVVDDNGGGDTKPASDHAAVFAGLRFVELKELAKYNPMRPHFVTQSIIHLQTLSYDGGWLAGGEDFFGHGNISVNSAKQPTVKFKAASDSDSVSVNWALGAKALRTDSLSWWYDLWEDDPGSCCEDHYDMQPWDGKDTSSLFRPTTSLWAFTKNNGAVGQAVCLAGLAASCDPVDTLQPIAAIRGTDSESAIVTHRLDVVEAQ